MEDRIGTSSLDCWAHVLVQRAKKMTVSSPQVDVMSVQASASFMAEMDNTCVVAAKAAA